jgi:hypothetical protein
LRLHEPHFKVCASILAHFCQVLRSLEFAAMRRISACDLARKRCLSLDVLVAYLLQMICGRSLQVGLDQFLGGLDGTAGLARRVTQSAFSQARKKLNLSAFSALSRMWVQR